MWRKLLRRVHPDAGGDGDLFVWAQALREHVAGVGPEDVRTAQDRRQPPTHATAGERIGFTHAYDVAEGFDALTDRALRISADAGQPHARLLWLLGDLREAPAHDVAKSRQQQQGATYRTLAAIAYAAGMTSEERYRWYEICRSIPMSQRHAGHILAKLRQEAA